MKKILVCILGADGQLGQEFRYIHPSYEYFHFDFYSKSTCDIGNQEQLNSVLRSKEYDYVINCAAYTAVDKAESDHEKCYLVNTKACEYICNSLKGTKSRLVHFSSDYVYHSYQGFPLNETDSCHPVGIYAKSKFEGEKVIRSSTVPALILRTSWVISSFGHNFVKTMLKLGSEKSNINVVNDQWGTVTYARDIAKAVLEIITAMISEKNDETLFNQTYNYSSEGITTWYDIATIIMKEANLPCVVHPIPSSQYPTPAQRPMWSVMAKNKIRTNFDLEIPHWYTALKECMQNI